MRTLLAAGALALLPAGSAAAQCGTGCSGSASCGGSGASACTTQCDNAGGCTCRDKPCKPPVEPTALAPFAEGPLRFAAGAAAPAVALLVLDCQGNVRDVYLPGGAAAEIVLRTPDAGPPRRLAHGGHAARPEGLR